MELLTPLLEGPSNMTKSPFAIGTPPMKAAAVFGESSFTSCGKLPGI